MSDPYAPRPGHPGWIDLTVPDADATRDFYARVVGWTPEPVSMGDYADYNMTTEEGTPAAGICHARGGNAGLPPVWMVYFTVADLDASLAAVTSGGGEVLRPATAAGAGRYAVIRDPAGAACALYQVVEE